MQLKDNAINYVCKVPKIVLAIYKLHLTSHK